MTATPLTRAITLAIVKALTATSYGQIRSHLQLNTVKLNDIARFYIKNRINGKFTADQKVQLEFLNMWTELSASFCEYLLRNCTTPDEMVHTLEKFKINCGFEFFGEVFHEELEKIISSQQHLMV